VAAGPRLIDVLNELFRGTTLVKEKLEAYSLLRDLAEEVASGRATLEEAEPYLKQAIESIQSLLAGAGKGIPPEEVESRIRDAFKREVHAISLGALRHELARRLAKRLASRGF